MVLQKKEKEIQKKKIIIAEKVISNFIRFENEKIDFANTKMCGKYTNQQ